METAYVECRGLEKVLFVIYETDYAHQLGDLTTAHFYDAVYEGTEGLLVLIPAFFQILSYLPDLVSGGLAGLVKSIVVQCVINEGTEAVLGDGPEAQAVAMSLSIATGHWTQGESTATRNIAAELRASEALEHGALSTRGLPAHGEHISGGHVAEQPQALGTGEKHARAKPDYDQTHSHGTGRARRTRHRKQRDTAAPTTSTDPHRRAGRQSPRLVCDRPVPRKRCQVPACRHRRQFPGSRESHRNALPGVRHP